MAQIVKLRRSSVSGQKPTNTNLQLGELAQNTTDGKIFLAKSGSGGPSIEELIVTNTSNTGSINLLGSVSASNFTGSFIGDGALLYNIPASGVTGLQLDRITSGNVSASISPSTGLVINTGVTITGSISATEFTGSGLGLTNVPFHVSGSDVNGGTYNKQFTKLQFDDSTGLNVSESVAGTAFISIGSHFRDIFVSGSDMLRATGSDAFEIIPEGGIEVTTSITDTNSNGYVKELRLSTTTLSSSLDTRIDNLSSSVVYQSETSSMTVLSSSYALTASFALNAGAGAEGRTYIHTQSSTSTTWTVTHNLGEKYPAIIVFDSSDNVIVPGTITAINDNSFTVTFPSAQTGKVSATVGGGLPFVSASFVDYVLAVNNDVPYWKGGVISGSAQIILTGTTGYSTLSSSIATTTNLLDGRIDSLETESGSIRTDFNSFTSSYTIVSSSLDSRLDVLETYSGSQQVPTASFSFRTAETSVYCKNTAGYQINKGQVVRIVGSVGDNPLIATASYENENDSANTLGIATENIPNDSFGMVITEGVLLGVNTLGMTGGQLLYLGTNGSFTTTEPIAPNHGVRLGEVLRIQQNNGSIYVRVDNGMELGEGHDVLFSGTSAGDLIVRNSSNLWVNTKQLTGSYHITGSLNATSLTGSINYNNLTNAPTLVSGSSQILLTGTTGYSTFSSSVATTTSNIETRVGSIETKTGSYATTGSNLFIGTQTLSGSIIPSVDNLYDLGSSTHQWRDVYISSGSLYIDGTKVISSTTQELQITTDLGQSIKILEGGNDSIILQTADGDIELKSNSDGDILLDPTNGKILLKGTVEVLSGNKIQSSVGGTPVVFANDIVVSGSIELTGTIDGIDLTLFSSSVNTRLTNLESSGGSLNSFTSSANSRLNALETTSGSLNSYTSSTNIRLNSIETSTSSLNTFSSSTLTRLTSIETSTSSLNSFSSSTNNKLTSLETSTSSLNSYTSSNNTVIGTLQTSTGSLNSFTSSANGRLNSIEGVTGSIALLNTYTGSNDTVIGTLQTSTSSLNSYTSSNTSNINAIHTATGSLNSYTSSNDGKISAIHTSTSSLNSFTSSAGDRLTSIETSTGSLNTFSSSTNTRVSALETESGSIRTAFNSYTSSNDGTNTTQNGRLTSLEGKTGSYATTGSNIFIGDQIVTGSLYVSQNLIIGGSSSIQHITSSQLNIGDNIITVNAQNPSIRFGGLAVIDSGSSPQVSGSILFDSVKDEWLFVHQNQSTVTSSVLLMGPETFNNIGGETYLTQNRIPKGTGIEHLNDSNITDTGTKVSINSNTEITGTFVATGTALVSGSSQINHNTTTNYVANEHINHTSVSISAGNGLSGGGDISSTRTITLDTGSVHFTGGVKSKMNTDGVISGSAQVVAALPSGTVSGSSQVLNGSGVWSGSAQLPSGVVSGSSQVSFSGLSGVPSGLVSGSSQVSFSGLSGVPSGLVSGSSQISFGSISGIPSGLVSGSSQISFGSISGVPSGLVSGSSQIDHNSTTNYVANQHIDHTTVSISAGSGLSGGGTIAATRTLTLDTGSAHFTSGARTTLSFTAGSGGYNSSTGVITIPTNTNQLTNGAGYITSYTETDTLATVTGRGASTSTALTLSGRVTFSSTLANRPQFPGGILGLDTGDGNFDIWGISRDYYPSHGTAANAWGLRWNGDNNDFEFVGGGTNRVILDMDGGVVTATTFSGALSGNATTATTATNWGTYGAVPSAGTSFGNANTIGRSDGNGYTFFNYINSNTANSENPTISQVIVTNGGDNYYRKASIAHLTSAVQSNASGNWSINASNITSYTINQSVGSSNSPTFAGLTVNGSTTTNGVGVFTSSNDNQIALRSTDTWAGIEFDDTNSSPDYIWYHGGSQTFAIGSGGSNVSGKKLHVHGGMTVGSNYASTGTQTNGLTVEGNIVAASYVVIGGNYGNNAYSSVDSTRLMFGGGDSDATGNYYIGTNKENVGGNYTKLDLRWHTGIRMGAQAGYGGIRFFDSEDLGTVLFSIGNTDGNVRSHTNLIPSANNSYNLGSASLGWANVYTNDLHLSNMNKPEGNDIDGTNGNWTIQEGAENLYIINNNNGKKFKISLEEI